MARRTPARAAGGSTPAAAAAAATGPGGGGRPRAALAGRLFVHRDDGPALEPAAGRAQRRVAQKPPRQLAGRRGREPLLRLQGAEEGRAAAEEPAEGRSGAGDDVRAPWATTPRADRTAAPDQAGLHRPAAGRRGLDAERPARRRTSRPSSSPPSAPRPTIRASSPTSPGLTTRERRSPSIPAATSRRTRRCGGRCRFRPASAGGSSPPSTAASSTKTARTARRSTVSATSRSRTAWRP